MRKKLWRWVLRNHEEGTLLHKWQIFIRIVLFPLETFYYFMNKSHGYQVEMDLWIIDGIKISGEFFRCLTNDMGKFRIIKRGNSIVILERLND